MEIRILGFNGSYPAAKGACSGYLVSQGEDRVLMDCGPGVLARLMARTDPASLRAVLLSHGHGDHCSDMISLRYYMDIRCQQDGLPPLDVYAPEDDQSPVVQFLKSSDSVRVHKIKAGDIIRAGSLRILCGPARHPVPAVGFRIGGFGYTGDTNTLPELSDFYKGVEVLLADGCFLQSQWREEGAHLSAVKAAELARDLGAGHLVITHLRPCMDEAALLLEARAVFANTDLAKEDMLLKADGGK